MLVCGCVGGGALKGTREDENFANTQNVRSVKSSTLIGSKMADAHKYSNLKSYL